jgi:hypothetical protein
MSRHSNRKDIFVPKKNEPPRKRSTHAEIEKTPEQLRAAYRRKRRFRVIGWSVMSVRAAVALQHWLAHLGAFGAQPPGWIDLAAGYPMAGLLILAGAITVSQK